MAHVHTPNCSCSSAAPSTKSTNSPKFQKGFTAIKWPKKTKAHGKTRIVYK